MGTENERIAIIETELQSIKCDIHSLYKKTDEINSLNTAIALLTASVNDLKSTVNALNGKLDTATNEPIKEKANKWNEIIKLIIAGVMGLAFGYIGMKLGVK